MEINDDIVLYPDIKIFWEKLGFRVEKVSYADIDVYTADGRVLLPLAIYFKLNKEWIHYPEDKSLGCRLSTEAMLRYIKMRVFW